MKIENMFSLFVEFEINLAIVDGDAFPHLDKVKVKKAKNLKPSFKLKALTYQFSRGQV